ncbi:MAG: LamG domain-containing protein [Pedosphaera sp.]|nr:LamG domain-containing protein [Pedosphaera sp.]
MNHSLWIGNGGDSSDLLFRIDAGYHDVVMPDALRTNHWVHIAAVSSGRGMQLFFNGALVGTNNFTGSFQWAGNGRYHFLGRSKSDVDDSGGHCFTGQMDEVRVWRVARTGQQIRENMFRTLTGEKWGLAALWNFEHPTHPSNDASPAGHHGKLRGQARVGRRRFQRR